MYTININDTKIQIVGRIDTTAIKKLTGINSPVADVQIHPGAIKLDPSGYLFVSSFYDMHNGPFKIQKRLASGRLIPFRSIDESY